jgi:transcriptional regulator of heat shock response
MVFEAISSTASKTDKSIESLESELLKKIQELYQDNKNFQKELDASLITRLDKHKSDIQVEVRNEGTQIQRGFETTLNTNFNSMESKLKELFDVQSKQLNMLKILMFVTIGIGIGLAIGLYLK